MTDPSGRKIDVPHDALIVSHTDERGVILSVNDDFMSISGYAAEELISAPHKIVRHPDMPKGVFQLLWDNLKAGKPFAGYIKNLCKSGDAYWILAVITPLDGGYMSMRIRASPDKIATMASLYDTLRQSERDGDLTPQESAAEIENAAKRMGSPHYTSFIGQQLTDEIIARDLLLGRPENHRIAAVASSITDWQTAWSDCDDILTAYEAFDLKPMNMRIQSGHLNDEGTALNVIASNFATISAGINHDLEKFSAAMEAVNDTILECLFLIHVQSLISETSHVLQKEGRTADDVFGLFTRQNDVYAELISKCERRVLRSLTEFLDATETIKRQLSVLSVTRVMCAIEVAQLKQSDGTDLTAIINDLDTFQATTRQKLGQISVRLIRMRSALAHQQLLAVG